METEHKRKPEQTLATNIGSLWGEKKSETKPQLQHAPEVRKQTKASETVAIVLKLNALGRARSGKTVQEEGIEQKNVLIALL